MNTQPISSNRIEAVMKEVQEELSPLLSRLDFEALAKHNRGYQRYAADPTSLFIKAEIHNHKKIIERLTQSLSANSRIMEIGFFIPMVPIALAKLGFNVEAIEKLDFYGDALNELIELASHKYGVVVHNMDVLGDDIEPLVNRYDWVVLSAILEHLNGSPRDLLRRCRTLGKDDALFWISVPNAVSLYKRILMFLKGIPPFPPIADYYGSAYPFTGHNREYTIGDLTFVIEQSGFDILSLEGHNRPLQTFHSLSQFLIDIISEIAPDSCKQSLAAVARKRRGSTL